MTTPCAVRGCPSRLRHGDPNDQWLCPGHRMVENYSIAEYRHRIGAGLDYDHAAITEGDDHDRR